jgi:hypothetical protein
MKAAPPPKPFDANNDALKCVSGTLAHAAAVAERQ